ncbi:hypothetical protein Acr_04g0005500 [Actinidia rufa]|uniref:C2 NT-type domain-containing protein n=1 Tax=Actinidia rufa TaxID=165716 RepID=A0A7J0EHQ9_9ERIC|nr:hypothetical protein Acr_04g0005500 [Actinidia rufa]
MVFFSLVFAPCISADYRRVVKIKGGWSHGDGTLGPQCGVKGEGEWTTIPQAGWDKLFISFVPADSVKATAKTTKSNVRNGTCKWGDPIYETTRLLKDSKSKQYDEKLYKFVVAMGSSRSSILGEISINLADYADAMKPSIVALPLDGCDSGTVLHVAIQLLTSKTGFREFEQQRELRERGLQTGTDQNRHEGFGTGKVSSSVEFTNDQTDKVNARVRFRPESKDLPSLEEEVGLTEQYADSAAGFDGSSNTSESLCAEKHDTSSTHEIDSLKSMVSGDLNGLSHCQSPREEKGDTSDHRNLAQGSIDSVHGWSSDYSIDNDLAIAYEENNRLRGCLEVAESSILELKLEVSSLQSHADEIGIEARRLSQQFAAEIISGEELAKEVSVMKSECSTLKDDLEELKILKLSPQFASRKTGNSNQDILFQGIQIRWVSSLRLGGIAHFSAGLKQGTEETSCSLSLPSEMTNIKEISEINSRESKQFISGNGFDVDLYHPPDMLHCLSIPSIASQEPDLTGATVSMKEKIFELLRELDDSKAEREILARKMDQMECYYEALIQELEQNQKQMLGELQNLRNEHSACLYTIATTSAEMESMHQDMNEQIIRFTEERRDLDSINRELERKAVTSEAALRRTRLNYSIAVNQLQKDLDFLSSQVLSMFATNENLIKQTVSETSQPCFLGNPDAARNPEESDASKLSQYQSQNAGVKKQVLGGDILLEDMKKSLLLQEGLYLKVEEELSEMHVANVHLDVFSKILQETLLEASAGIMLMKKKIDELTQKMDLSTASKKLLLLQLQTAMDDVQALNEYKASCMAKCSDMALSYESKYKASFDEKTEMANLLKQETLNKVNLQNEVSYLQELKTLKAEQSELAYSKENLQKTVSFLEDKLGSLGESYHKKFYGLFPSANSVRHDPGSMDFMGVIPQLEEFQHNACEKILQLLEEKKNLENERDLAQMSSSTASSELLVLKQKFKHDVQNMTTKLEAANGLVEKFQLELETLANKFHISSEAEDKYAHQNEELSADLTLLEAELQQLTSKNVELAKEILGLDTLTEELGRSKFIIAELTRERDLAQMSSSTASSEILVLKQKFKHDVQNMATKLEAVNGLVEKFQLELETLANKLHISSEAEEKYAHQNEEFSADLALLEVELQQLTLKNVDLAKEILGLDTLTEELGRSKLIIAELTGKRQDLMISLQDKTEESVKLSSELNNLKESLRFLHDELNVERSCRDKLEGTITDLTSQLNGKNDHLLQFSQQEAELAHFRQLASDLLREQSGVFHILQQHEECLEKIREDSSRLTDLESQSSELHEYSSEKHLGELRKKLFDVEVMLNRSFTGEAHFIEENTNLVNTVDSLRSELKASVAQNGVVSDLNSIMAVQLEEYKKRVAELDLNFSNDKNEHSLEELKDHAEAECLQARKKREHEGPSGAVQESLRIAFIKEQYETRLQELRQQLYVTKKHGEDMLWKLQDSVDELENKKKSEASHLKRNEELALKILELEAELQSLVSEKQKQRLEDSLQECNEENNRIATELTLTKGQLESSESAMKIRKEESNGSDDVGYTSGDTILGKAYRENPVVGTSSIENRTLDTAGNGSTGRPFSNCSDQHSLMNSEEVEDASSIPTVEDEHSTAPAKMQPFKDVIVAESGHGISKHAFVEQWALLLNDSKHVAVINNQFKTRSLQFSMDHLHKELEKMKNENSLLPLADRHFEPIFQGFQTELMQLHKLVKVNEELRSIFPVFSEVSDGGNALERVLALEIELAEALQSKKKSSILFQRYAGVESELKEMHDRYSQLSLQFTEVEGERQRLMMTLKNVRASKRFYAVELLHVSYSWGPPLVGRALSIPPMPCLPSSRSHASPALDVNGTLHKINNLCIETESRVLSLCNLKDDLYKL